LISAPDARMDRCDGHKASPWKPVQLHQGGAWESDLRRST